MSGLEGAASRGIIALDDLIDKTQCHCLNDSDSKPFTNLFIGDERLLCSSADDHEIMMTFTFRESVRLHSINIVAPDSDAAPRTIKLFVNRTSIGFEDTDGPCEQVLTLSAADMKKERVCELKMAKFNYVNSVTVYVAENQGAECTEISAISFNGQPLQKMDMKEFKKVGC
ncbi:putative thioredoxin-like protein [Pelagophyceae sp. CCMP2097]|nr:putative thioredoxin-like protein [Pelagophyceae sp. CCMP2097]